MGSTAGLTCSRLLLGNFCWKLMASREAVWVGADDLTCRRRSGSETSESEADETLQVGEDRG